MSRIITVVNDELKERQDVGQGWDGFYLWTSHEDVVLALNYMATRAFDTKTAIRFIDEDQLYDEENKLWRNYKETTLKEIKRWLAERCPRYYEEAA